MVGQMANLKPPFFFFLLNVNCKYIVERGRVQRNIGTREDNISRTVHVKEAEYGNANIRSISLNGSA